YTWSPIGGNGATMSQTLPASTAYNVTISSGGCSKQFYFPMIVIPYPKDTIISSGLSCLSNTISLDGSQSAAGSYSWTTNGGSYTSPTNTTTAIGSGPGTYYLSITDPVTTCVSIDSVVIASPTLPTALINVPQTVCTPQTVTLNDSTSSTGATISYSWTTTGGNIVSGANTASAVVSASGVYSLTVSDSNTGCNATATTTVTVNQSPGPPTLSGTITNPFNVCAGSGPQTLSVTPSGTITSVPVWYVGQPITATGVTGNTYTASTTTAGTTIYTVVDSATATGCKDTSASNALTVTVTVNPTPPPPTYSVPTGPNTAYCQDSPTTMSVNSGTATAVWYLNNTVVNVGSTYTPPANLPAGTYVYNVIDSIPIPGGCTSGSPGSGGSIAITVTVNPTPPPPTYSVPTGPNTAYCQGSPTTMSVNSGTATAVWYLNNTVVNVGSTYTPPANLPAGTYVYNVMDSIPIPGGCTSGSPSSGGALTITVTVNPTPPPPIITAPTGTNNAYCQGSPTPLTVNSSTSTAVWYYNGSVVNIGSSFTPPAATYTPGTYVFNVIDSIPTVGGCTSSAPNAGTVITLTVYPTPTVNVAGAIKDTATCGQINGGVHGISSSNVTSGTAPYSFAWINTSVSSTDTVSHSATLGNQPAGTYNLVVTDANGCVANTTGGSSTFTVPAIAQPTALISTTPSPATGAAPLNVVFTNQSINVDSTKTVYVWIFGDNNTGGIAHDTSHTYTSTGSYTATLIAITGSCSDTARVPILVETPTTLVIPNVFTPNGDGVNDVFFIINTGMVSLNCDIYNRWGQLLHTITAPNQGWDGIVPNGDKAPDGTYMYILQAQGVDGKTYKQNGTVTLIR
ncbi:MAG TPA: gliding motility-associated C-terminal domain-containing protein, partial [Bacteroidia bacterium]|nr:gliding motility-associated C-terminal domain-containing protein [Bacteroidia bacterium]